MRYLAYLLIGVATASAHPALAQVQQVMTTTGDQPLVSLTVTEAIQSAPDIATIGAGVQTTALTATEALRLNSARMDTLIKALKARGVDAKDIQTTGINLNPQYDYNKGQPRFTGYQVNNMVSVRSRNIAKLGELLDALVAAGGNSISGPTFSVEDPQAQLRQARANALKTAADQAQFYAKASGYGRTRLVSISETQNYMRPYDAMAPVPVAVEAKAQAAPIEPGQVSNSVTLTVQYRLEN